MAGAARGRSGANASEQEAGETTAAEAPERVAATVTFDLVTWQEPKAGKPGEFNHFRATKGMPVNLPQEVFDSLSAAYAVAAPEDAAEVTEAVENAHGPVDDETLASMQASELIAYVTQNPDEAARVGLMEQARDAAAQRPEVLEAAGVEPEQV